MEGLGLELMHTGGDTFGLKVKDPSAWLGQLVLLQEKILCKKVTKSLSSASTAASTGTRANRRPRW